MGQRISRPSFSQATGGLNVTAPSNPNTAPPGYYMLFILNSNGVPSVAKIVQISGTYCDSNTDSDCNLNANFYTYAEPDSNAKCNTNFDPNCDCNRLPLRRRLQRQQLILLQQRHRLPRPDLGLRFS